MTPFFAFGFPSLGIGEFIGFVLLVVFVIFVNVLIFQWLWNVTIPEIFGLPLIRFWQAFRLIIIAGMLFGGLTFIRSNMTAPSPTVSNIYIGQPPYELKK